jgi:YggT family protein
MVSLLNIVDTALTILTYLIIIQAVLSWVQPDPNHPFTRLLRVVTDPILRPLDRIIPPIGGLSITPIIAIILIQLVQGALPRLLGVY